MPCVGSALIIWGGETGGSLVGTLLSWRPVVFVGLISYSLYLWQWPVIVLRQMGVIVGLGAISSQRVALLSTHQFDVLIEIALSFVLAVVSWAVVERPFRNGPLRLSGRPLFVAASAAMLILLSFARSPCLPGDSVRAFLRMLFKSHLTSTEMRNFV